MLIDRVEGENFVGRTEFDSVEVDNEVLIPNEGNYLRIGEFANVEITGAEHFDLFGKVASNGSFNHFSDHTARFNRLILDYLNESSDLSEFYGLSHELENYTKKIEERNQFPFHRDLLSDSLTDQYKSIGGAKGSVSTNIEALWQDSTYTVTTGHQLNIYTGRCTLFIRSCTR